MINLFEHTPTGDLVQFPAAPLRSGSEAVRRAQVSGYDSDGYIYVYSRNNRQWHANSLIYTNVPLAVLDTLRIFVQSRNGDKLPFTWYDHLGTSHAVRFTAGALDYKETSHGKYRVEVGVTEES